VQVKHAKQLISHDAHNNSYNYKYTYSVEIAPICRDDLLLVPREYNMGIGPLVVCYKVSNSIHVIDPITMQMGEIQSEKYWKHPIRSFTFIKQMCEFIVIDIEEDNMPWHRQPENLNECETSTASTRSFAFRHRPGYSRFKKIEVEVARADDMNVTYRLFTHLGHVLRVGDSVLGYDLTRLIGNSVEQEDLAPNTPDVILIKKVYTHLKKSNRKRVFKLERMNVEKQKDEGYDEFMDEVEQDPEMRAHINLYMNEQAKPEDFKEQHEDETFPAVQLEELLENLTLEDKS
jgi:nonsense-mediated mRNA decay protein 3